jgi:hypothetical protein
VGKEDEVMAFWERIFKGRLFPSGKREGETGRATTERLPAEELDSFPAWVAELEMDGRKCVLDTFALEFVRHDGSERVRAGILSLSTTEPLPETLGRWVTLDTLRKEGAVRFYANETSLSTGSAFEILFSDATCMGYGRRVDERTGALTTTLNIAPRILRIEGEVMDNFS